MFISTDCMRLRISCGIYQLSQVLVSNVCLLQGILEWVMDSMHKGKREIQEKIILMQKEKDQVRIHYNRPYDRKPL